MFATQVHDHRFLYGCDFFTWIYSLLLKEFLCILYFFYFGVFSSVFVLKHKYVRRKQTEAVTGFEVRFRNCKQLENAAFITQYAEIITILFTGSCAVNCPFLLSFFLSFSA
jgi:hypothetical protein